MMNLVMVTVASEEPRSDSEIPLVAYVDSEKAPPRGEMARARFVATRRNFAIEKALRLYPQATDFMMVDTYFLNQPRQLDRLALDYESVKPCILGASTWWTDNRTILKKTKFWDTWVTPLYDGASFSMQGIVETSAVGGCYCLPRSIIENGLRYELPEAWQMSEHVPFCRGSHLPVYIDFNVKLFHPSPFTYSTRKRAFITAKKLAIKLRNRLVTKAYRWSPYHLWRLYKPFQNLSMMHEAWLKKKVLGASATTFVDVGANVGTWGLDASLYFDDVHEFEPDPKTMIILQKNFAMNNRHNATFYPYALGAERAWKRLRRYQFSGWNSTLERPIIQEAKLKGEVVIPIRTLDSFNLQLDRKSVVKIDTEGNEVNVLEGATNSLKAHPQLVIETHSEPNIQACKNIMVENKYEIEEIWIPGQTYLIGR